MACNCSSLKMSTILDVHFFCHNFELLFFICPAICIIFTEFGLFLLILLLGTKSYKGPFIVYVSCWG